jgi:hypothetical protein
VFDVVDEIVEISVELDPVKRTWVYKPKVIKKRGRLRWIGDLIVNGLSRVARRIGFVPNSNRRQSGGFMGNMATFAVTNFNRIPREAMIHVMDFTADVTNIMKRRGNVYPLIRAAGIGYYDGSTATRRYGEDRQDDYDDNGAPPSLCETQISDACSGWWSHLETHNNYDGGALSRRVAEERVSRVRDGGVAGDQWNFMQAKDIFAPEVFLCKAGRFLENIVNKNMDVKDYDAPIREKFGSDEFADSCDPNHFNGVRSSNNNLESDSDSGSQNENEEVEFEDFEQTDDSKLAADEGPFPGGEVIEVSKQELDELPIIVFEGLPPKLPDQNEEDLVNEILKKTGSFPKSSVKKALRMPIATPDGKSLVMVEMDTAENEMKVLEKSSDIKSSVLRSKSLDQVGIRELNYNKLWSLVQDLSAVNRVVAPTLASSNSDLSNNVTTTTQAPMQTNAEQDAEIVEDPK